MARLTDANVALAKEMMARFPRPRSALVPIVHVAQEQDGYVTEDAMAHIAELLDITPAEVYGVASFYEMFKFEPIGRYCVNICTNISCQLLGAWELLEHAEARLGVKAGGTTADGLFTLEDVECIAACTEAPALEVNYRLIEDLRAGKLRDEIPDHGVLARVRQRVAPDRWADTGIEAQAKVDAR
jgi:NADH-quinone oxidoreductase subunit E